MEKLELVGMPNSAAILANSLAVTYTVKHTLTIDLAVLLLVFT